jgi:mannose-6-phosphate isomerase-like protein (cupin superfamily)
MEQGPVNLSEALSSFHALWSPHIIAQINDYDVRIAHVEGEHVWHAHDDTDEFFLVLGGEFNIAMRSDDGDERVVRLQEGDAYVVPKGVSHRPFSPGASILMFEPTGTLSTGDSEEGGIPEGVDKTTGHKLNY